MGSGGNLYSQWVGWAKILLPLSGLALLSTLFLLARGPNDGTDISLERVVALAREQQVSAPEFSGLTDTGAVVVITARSARPTQDRPDTADVDDIRMRMNNPDGSTVDATGVVGEIDGRARTAYFSGLVRVQTSTGYTMETGGLTVTLDTGTAVSDGLLEIRAPMGNLTAGQVTFRYDSANTRHQMLFTDGVRLIYTPQG